MNLPITTTTRRDPVINFFAKRGMINRIYEEKMQSGHIKETYPHELGATNNNTTSNTHKWQTCTVNQDEDIEMQLEPVTP
jgi:hypothetical protein